VRLIYLFQVEMTGRHENWNISMPSTIIMDGASFHKHEELRVYIEDEMGRVCCFFRFIRMSFISLDL
jgi:hypothetical protein